MFREKQLKIQEVIRKCELSSVYVEHRPDSKTVHEPGLAVFLASCRQNLASRLGD